MSGDPLALEAAGILVRISDDITNLILEYGVGVPKVEAWIDDAIETAEALSLQKRAGPEEPAASLPATRKGAPRR